MDVAFHLAPSEQGRIAICGGPFGGLGFMPAPTDEVNGLHVILHDGKDTTVDYKGILGNTQGVEASLKSAVEEAKKNDKHLSKEENLTVKTQKINHVNLRDAYLFFVADVELSKSEATFFKFQVTWAAKPSGDKEVVNDNTSIRVTMFETIKSDLYASSGHKVETHFRNDEAPKFDVEKVIGNTSILKDVVTKGIEFYNEAKKQSYEANVGKIVSHNESDLGLNKVIVFNESAVFYFKLNVTNDQNENKTVNIQFEYNPSQGKVVHYYMEK